MIATGFERELVQQQEVERVKESVAAAVKPAPLRKIANSAYSGRADGLDDEWDVPTFLRKQAD